MPTYQYQCNADIVPHPVERFFKTFEEAAPFINQIDCPEHKTPAKRIMSVAAFALYGDPSGYDKPSPTKRFSTKTVSQKDGNKHAA